MRFPDPSLSEYAVNTAVVVLTLAVLQYTGWLSDDPAGLDPALLVVVAVTFPVFTYLLAVLAANVRWIPE
ncbi:hypothetical protein DM2_1304 [Halorubrum sp. DM2]|uniref:hypothetical protein n=1 Tax=Halorubrum sp. DM2 TaxID=2527867 RepID=UPI0024B6ADAF|nr:hypothetical protein [Halorubrum sp. DM2]VTT87970.1 hypothetical protein DM2_1304 [Halorubrum sp. DM2]